MNERQLRGLIYRLWAPLALTWVMMSLEGPVVSSLVARLPAPKENLAAYGVVLSIVLLLESPIFGMISAAIAIVEDQTSLARLRRFSHLNGAVLSICILLLTVDVFFAATVERIFPFDPELAGLVKRGLLISSINPFAVGYRRFYQGILVRSGRGRGIVIGTVGRMIAMVGTALYMFHRGGWSGVEVASLAITTGIVVEAALARLMAVDELRELNLLTAEAPRHDLSFRGLARFYYPLAMSTVIALSVGPLISFFLSRSILPLESLALYPVLNSVTLLFRATGFAFQEVTVAIMAREEGSEGTLRRVMLEIGVVSTSALGILLLTPLREVIFGGINGLPPDLVELSKLPGVILTASPFLAAWICHERGYFVIKQRTAVITLSGAVELGTIALLMWLGVYVYPFIGINVSSVASMIGALLSGIWLTMRRRS